MSKSIKFVIDDTLYIPIAKYVYGVIWRFLPIKNATLSELEIDRYLSRFHTPVRTVIHDRDIYKCVPYYTYLEILYDLSPRLTDDDSDDDNMTTLST